MSPTSAPTGWIVEYVIFDRPALSYTALSEYDMNAVVDTTCTTSPVCKANLKVSKVCPGLTTRLAARYTRSVSDPPDPLGITYMLVAADAVPLLVAITDATLLYVAVASVATVLA
jgi:hypothetical protein